MARVMGRLPTDQTEQVTLDLSDRKDEIRKPGMLCAEDAPEQSEYDQAKHNATKQHMQMKPLIFHDVGDEKTACK